MKLRRKLTITGLTHQISDVQILCKTKEFGVTTTAEYFNGLKWYEEWFPWLFHPNLPDVYFTDYKGKVLKTFAEEAGLILVSIPKQIFKLSDKHYIYIYYPRSMSEELNK